MITGVAVHVAAGVVLVVVAAATIVDAVVIYYFNHCYNINTEIFRQKRCQK